MGAQFHVERLTLEEEPTHMFTINSFSVIHNTIEGEAVVMNLDTGMYFSFNHEASLIWQKIVETQFSEESIRRFAGPQNHHFIEFLINQKLVSPEDATAVAADSETLPGSLYEVAEWQEFSDMKELLLLDPVHDIALSENGRSEPSGLQKEP